MRKGSYNRPARRLPSRGMITLALALLLTATASAMVFQKAEHQHISNLHHIEDDYYSYSQDLTVDGVIDGELASFSYNFQLNGEVTGTANVFAYQLSHRGQIGRTLRGFANSITIDGTIGRSALLFGNDIMINGPAVIERDARLYGNNVRMYGTIKGPANIAGRSIIIEGLIEGDLVLRTDGKIEIAPTAIITGNLTYTSADEDALEIAEGAAIGGEVTWTPPEDAGQEDDGPLSARGVILAIAKLLAAFLFGVILVAVFRRYAEESYAQLNTRPIVALAVGFVVLIGFALALVILIIAVALVIAGLIVVSGDGIVVGALLLIFSTLMLPISSFASVCGGIMLYAGKIVVALLLGALLLRRAHTDRALSAWNLLIGLVLLTIAFAIPYLGFLLYLLASVAGAGAIALGVRFCKRALPPITAATPPTDPAAPAPPPLP